MIRIDPVKIEFICKWIRSENLTELRDFLGLVQFFKHFVRNFLELAKPLTDLTRKDKGIVAWNEDCTRVFHMMKEVLTTAPILAAPDWLKSFKLHVDASQFAVEGTLTQENDEGCVRVIAYTSKMMTPVEQNYTANDRGFIALIHGLQRFRCYMEGATFSVISDNQVVSYVFSKANLSLTEARWLEILAHFNIDELTMTAGKLLSWGRVVSGPTHEGEEDTGGVLKC